MESRWAIRRPASLKQQAKTDEADADSLSWPMCEMALERQNHPCLGTPKDARKPGMGAVDLERGDRVSRRDEAASSVSAIGLLAATNEGG